MLRGETAAEQILLEGPRFGNPHPHQVSEGTNKIHHIEKMALWLGPGMAEDDWIEFEYNPFGVYQARHLPL